MQHTKVFYDQIPYEKKLEVWKDFYKKDDNVVGSIANRHGFSYHITNRIITEFKPYKNEDKN